MGVPWREQKAELPPSYIIEQIRQDLWRGHIDIKQWDHDHPDRYGRSNKRLALAARDISGTYPETGGKTDILKAWRTMLQSMGLTPIVDKDEEFNSADIEVVATAAEGFIESLRLGPQP